MSCLFRSGKTCKWLMLIHQTVIFFLQTSPPDSNQAHPYAFGALYTSFYMLSMCIHFRHFQANLPSFTCFASSMSTSTTPIFIPALLIKNTTCCCCCHSFLITCSYFFHAFIFFHLISVSFWPSCSLKHSVRACLCVSVHMRVWRCMVA